jgi:hypothetical protein
MILGLAATVVTPTNENLPQALETIGTTHVIRWAKISRAVASRLVPTNMKLPDLGTKTG